MIELYSRSIELQTRDGRVLLCDIDQLQGDLRRAFAAAGIREHWLAEQVLAAVELQGLLVDGISEPLDDAAFDALITRLLTDAGYPDVGSEFAVLRGREATSPATFEPRCAWDMNRLVKLIARELKPSAPLCAKLAELVAAKLAALGFADVADSLIVKVAEHTLDSLARAYRAVPAEAAGWLMPPGYWEAFFSGAPARLVASGALKIHPVSELFPVLRLTFDTARAAAQVATDGCGQDTTFAEAWKTCSEIAAETVASLVRETRDLMAKNQHHPVLVNLAGLSDCLNDKRWNIVRRHRKKAAAEAVQILTACLNAHGLNAIIAIEA